MADTKKEQERDELHKAIWGIADDLRGSVDGWDFKQYVLGMMFYRYISENLTNYINDGERAAGDTEFDYVYLSDDEAEGARESLVQEKGFFILQSACSTISRIPRRAAKARTIFRACSMMLMLIQISLALQLPNATKNL